MRHKNDEAQIAALWKEAEGRNKTMRNPMGFGGSGIWAIVFLLVVGVIWIRNEFGASIAGAAVLGVFGVLVFLAGQLTSIASRQADGNLRVAEKQADAAVEKERIKGENITAKYDAQMQLKTFVAMLGMVKQVTRQQQRALPEPEEAQPDPFVHELDPADFRFD